MGKFLGAVEKRIEKKIIDSGFVQIPRRTERRRRASITEPSPRASQRTFQGKC